MAEEEAIAHWFQHAQGPMLRSVMDREADETSVAGDAQGRGNVGGVLVVVEPERVFDLGGLGVVEQSGVLAEHVEDIVSEAHVASQLMQDLGGCQAGHHGETPRFGAVDRRRGAFALLVVVDV